MGPAPAGVCCLPYLPNQNARVSDAKPYRNRHRRHLVVTGVSVLLILAVIACLFSFHRLHQSQPYHVEEYWLEQLVDRPLKQPAPRSISDSILAEMKTEIDAYRKDGDWNGSMDHLIAVIPIDLKHDGITDYLAIPAHFIPAFHGAHSVQFWIFAGQADGGFRLMFSGREDAVQLCETSTHGYRDVIGIYHTIEDEKTLWRYDGTSYQCLEHGKASHP